MRIKARAWEFGILGALVVLYLVFLSLYFVPVADNVDANGYIGSARIFKEHGRFFQVPPDDYAFIGRMWVANSRGEYYPKYPPLYPALAGLMMMGFGVDAGFYVAPGCALLAVLGMYVLCRTQFSGPLSLLGAAALAANPVFNTFALRQMSHAPGMCLLVWAYAVFFLAPRKEAGRFRPALGDPSALPDLVEKRRQKISHRRSLSCRSGGPLCPVGRLPLEGFRGTLHDGLCTYRRANGFRVGISRK
jgi:4-amino-4-deoxy-L-arabinose transferase-like glycosyltransferase